MRGFYSMLTCLLALLLYQSQLKGVNASLDRRQLGESPLDRCQCVVTCPPSGATEKPGGAVYLFDPSSGSCFPQPSSSACSGACGFPSQDACLSECQNGSIGGCKSTPNGCCADGVTPKDTAGNCGDETEDAVAPPSDSGGGGIHWGLVITGGCVMVLLVAVLTVSGVVAYAYRHKHKQRQRRQYIQEVLQMYEDNSCSSDSSVEDNPEEKNLFDRL